MNRKFLGIIFCAALAFVSGTSNAQLGGLLGGSSGGMVSAETIVSKYVDGCKDVLTANASFLKALGSKEEAEAVALEAKNLTAGATSEAIESAAKVQTESSKAIETKLNEKNVTMDAKAKKDYAVGLLYLAKGLIKYKGVSTDVKNYKPGLSDIGKTAGAAIAIAKHLPESTENLYSTLKSAVSFALANKIPVPKEATSLL